MPLEKSVQVLDWIFHLIYHLKLNVNASLILKLLYCYPIDKSQCHVILLHDEKLNQYFMFLHISLTLCKESTYNISYSLLHMLKSVNSKQQNR